MPVKKRRAAPRTGPRTLGYSARVKEGWLAPGGLVDADVVRWGSRAALERLAVAWLLEGGEEPQIFTHRAERVCQDAGQQREIPQSAACAIRGVKLEPTENQTLERQRARAREVAAKQRAKAMRADAKRAKIAERAAAKREAAERKRQAFLERQEQRAAAARLQRTKLRAKGDEVIARAQRASLATGRSPAKARPLRAQTAVAKVRAEAARDEALTLSEAASAPPPPPVARLKPYAVMHLAKGDPWALGGVWLRPVAKRGGGGFLKIPQWAGSVKELGTLLDLKNSSDAPAEQTAKFRELLAAYMGRRDWRKCLVVGLRRNVPYRERSGGPVIGHTDTVEIALSSPRDKRERFKRWGADAAVFALLSQSGAEVEVSPGAEVFRWTRGGDAVAILMAARV